MSNPYAIDSITYNPYFQMAYNSPNFYGAATQIPPQAVTAANTTATTEAENKSAPKPKEEKKDNTIAALVLGTALTVGAAVLCRKAYNAGDGNILKGIKKWFSGAKNKVNDIIKPNTLSITEENGRYLCTVPNHTNRLTGEKAIQELGLSDSIPVISAQTKDGAYKLAEGIQIRKGTITADGKVYNVKNGKIINTTEPTGEKVQELLKKLNNGEQAEGIKIEEFLHTENGTTRVFTNKDGVFDLRLAISDKHNLNSPIVKQYRGKNEKTDKALQDYLVNGNKDGLKIQSAEIPTAQGTLVVKNGEVTGIKVDGNIHKKGSTEFDALFYDYKKEFESAIKNKDSYKKIVYQAA